MNLENTVEDMWALGTINKLEKDELGKKREMYVGRTWTREGEVMRRAILE